MLFNSCDLKCKSVYDVVLSFLNVEGTLGKIHPNKKDTERYVFLLDGLLICCKQVLCSLFWPLLHCKSNLAFFGFSFT